MNLTLERTYKATLKFLAPLNPEETYATVVKEAIAMTKAEYGSILLGSKEGLTRVYSSAPNVYNFKVRKNGITYSVYKSNKPKIISINELLKHHPEVGRMNARSNIVLPLAYQNRPIGVLSLWSKKSKHFTQNDLRNLKYYGPLASMAIRKTQLYAETQKALMTRDLFISMASHELKTPLTTVYAYLQLMQLKLSQGEMFDVKWIDTVLNEVTRLSKLIKELLQVDQIKTGDLHYNWKACSVKEICHRAVKDFQISHQDHRIILQDELLKGNDYIWADYDKIIQILINLLTNATKFSPQGSDIIVLAKRVDNQFILEVEDHGQGIPRKELSKIFEGFYRGSNHLHEGMGIGLYLTKQIVEKHIGSIKVSSKLGKGTTITIFLPAHSNDTRT